MDRIKYENWLDFGIYPVKSETYAEFLCLRFIAYNYGYVPQIIKGKYVNNPFCDEVGVVYNISKGKYLTEGFVPEEEILAWRNG